MGGKEDRLRDEKLIEPWLLVVATAYVSLNRGWAVTSSTVLLFRFVVPFQVC